MTERCTCHPQGVDGVTLLDFNEDELYIALQESIKGTTTIQFRNVSHTFSAPTVNAELSRRFHKRIQS